jgi:hypothetical protein
MLKFALLGMLLVIVLAAAAVGALSLRGLWISYQSNRHGKIQDPGKKKSGAEI